MSVDDVVAELRSAIKSSTAVEKAVAKLQSNFSPRTPEHAENRGIPKTREQDESTTCTT